VFRVVLVALVVALAWPSAALAEPEREPLCGTWGVNAWGLSYHIDHAIQYNGTNWGLGVRCYARPAWSMLGEGEDNKIFVQADALLNSHRGLVLPVGAGVEYKLSTLSSGCKLFFLGALVMAYYQAPDRGHKNQVRYGPVPGLDLACGRIRPNVIVVPNASRQMIAAIVASVTVMLR